MKNKKGADQISKFKDQLNKQSEKELQAHAKFVDQKYKDAFKDFAKRKTQIDKIVHTNSDASSKHTDKVIDALRMAKSAEEANYVHATVKNMAAKKRREIKKGLKVKAKLAKLSAKLVKKTKNQKMKMWLNAEAEHQAKKKKFIHERLNPKKLK